MCGLSPHLFEMEVTRLGGRLHSFWFFGVLMTRAKHFAAGKCACLGLMILLGISCVDAQQTDRNLPLVLTGEMPLYPVIARAARVQGIVKIKVSTDGEKVVSLDVKSGPPMLVRFAENNLKTWKFAEHKPTTFVTTFEYVIEETSYCGYQNGNVNLYLPSEVRITASGVKTCDPATGTESH
jgi:hypothetical protein